MLDALVGNQNIRKILVFLFVNGKCYGTQLHRILRTPLTPIQAALSRLEKGGIILSYYEGKTRLYQFNPAYPLLAELESLLKKAYTLLGASEKKEYYLGKEEWLQQAPSFNSHKVLQIFWQKLISVKELIFNAKTSSKEGGWNGKGKGEVVISSPDANTLIFHEKGAWHDRQGNAMTFTNVYRWVLDRNACVISLEHLRRGIENPVFLFYLAPISQTVLSSVDSHLCGEDAYFGQMHHSPRSLRMNWRVIGPEKNEELDYYYS